MVEKTIFFKKTVAQNFCRLYSQKNEGAGKVNQHSVTDRRAIKNKLQTTIQNILPSVKQTVF